MYRIYIVEDDREIAEGICACARTWGLDAKAAEDFSGIIDEFRAYDPHLVIMDITLPYMGGYHWCREIRKISSVPVVFVSSADDNMNIIMAMDMGADDFIAKPFDSNVLIAKIQALLRRAYDFAEKTEYPQHRGAELNTDENTLHYRGDKIELTRNEYRILLKLMQNRGKVVSREKLMEFLWETDCFVDENTLTVNVGRLRKKLEGVGLKNYIVTRFGVGYMLGDGDEPGETRDDV